MLYVVRGRDQPLYVSSAILGAVAAGYLVAYLGLVFPVAIAAGAVMTLAWGLLYTLMGDEKKGAVAGLATARARGADPRGDPAPLPAAPRGVARQP